VLAAAPTRQPSSAASADESSPAATAFTIARITAITIKPAPLIFPRTGIPLLNASYAHRSLAMRMFVVWILGLLASMIIGGMIGAWLLRNGFLGMLAGAFTFAGLRVWFEASTDEPPR